MREHERVEHERRHEGECCKILEYGAHGTKGTHADSREGPGWVRSHERTRAERRLGEIGSTGPEGWSRWWADTVGAKAATGVDTGAQVCEATMDTAGGTVGAADTGGEWDGTAAEATGAADMDAGARTGRTVAGADAGARTG